MWAGQWLHFLLSFLAGSPVLVSFFFFYDSDLYIALQEKKVLFVFFLNIDRLCFISLDAKETLVVVASHKRVHICKPNICYPLNIKYRHRLLVNSLQLKIHLKKIKVIVYVTILSRTFLKTNISTKGTSLMWYTLLQTCMCFYMSTYFCIYSLCISF